MIHLKMLSPDQKLAEIRRLYFETTKRTIQQDLERALEPILSEATERQVSSAFEDLSFAVRNEQRRSPTVVASESITV